MKKLFTAILVLLSVLSNVSFAGEITAEENSWVQAATVFYNEAKAAGLNAGVAVLTDPEAGGTPAFTMFDTDKKQCMFVVAVRNNRSAGFLMNMARTSHAQSVAKLAIFAHEYGHCLQDLADPTLTAHAGEGSPLESHATAKEEATSDVFALAWIAQNQPEDFEIAYRFMRDMRRIPQRGTDRYDVLDYVYKAHDLPTMMTKTPASPLAFAQYLVSGMPLPATSTAVAAAR